MRPDTQTPFRGVRSTAKNKHIEHETVMQKADLEVASAPLVRGCSRTYKHLSSTFVAYNIESDIENPTIFRRAYICVAVDNIPTDIVRRAVSLR